MLSAQNSLHSVLQTKIGPHLFLWYLWFLFTDFHKSFTVKIGNDQCKIYIIRVYRLIYIYRVYRVYIE